MCVSILACYLAWNAHASPHYIVISGLSAHILPHYLINGTIFWCGEGELLIMKRVFRFPLKLSPDIFFILRRNERDITINVPYIGLHVRCRLLLTDCNEISNFSTDFLKHTQISSFVKIRPVRAVLFPCGRTDGRTLRS